MRLLHISTMAGMCICTHGKGNLRDSSQMQTSAYKKPHSGAARDHGLDVTAWPLNKQLVRCWEPAPAQSGTDTFVDRNPPHQHLAPAPLPCGCSAHTGQTEPPAALSPGPEHTAATACAKAALIQQQHCTATAVYALTGECLITQGSKICFILLCAATSVSLV